MGKIFLCFPCRCNTFGTILAPMPELTKDSDFVEYVDDDEEARVIPEWDDPVDSAGNPIDQQPLYDKLINAELLLQHGDNMVNAKNIGRSIGLGGQTLGTYSEIPSINTMVYNIEFPDGLITETCIHKLMTKATKHVFLIVSSISLAIRKPSLLTIATL